MKNEYAREFLQSVRAGNGSWTDTNLNDSYRRVIQAMSLEYGECWLGKINLYGEKRDENNVYIWKWDEQFVRNFSCDFVLPRFDEELHNLIRQRDCGYTARHADYERLKKIMDRIKEIGGIHIFWS